MANLPLSVPSRRAYEGLLKWKKKWRCIVTIRRACAAPGLQELPSLVGTDTDIIGCGWHFIFTLEKRILFASLVLDFHNAHMKFLTKFSIFKKHVYTQYTFVC